MPQKTPPKFDAFVRKVLAYRPPKDAKAKAKEQQGRSRESRATPATPA